MTDAFAVRLLGPDDAEVLAHAAQGVFDDTVDRKLTLEFLSEAVRARDFPLVWSLAD
jgi:hypothetical protein